MHSVHGRPQLVRNIGQKFALGLAGRLRCAHGFFQLIGTVFDSFFEQPLLLQQRLLRRGQSLNHPIEALAQKLDFIAGLAHLDWLQAAISGGRDARLEAGRSGAPASEW